MDFQEGHRTCVPSIHAITPLWYLAPLTLDLIIIKSLHHSTNSWKVDVVYIACTHLPAFMVA